MSGGDHLERLEAARNGARRVHHALGEPHPDAILVDEPDLSAAVAELKQLRAIAAEGDQRSRALALLLLRNGGQVEFTHAEQVSAPWHGQLISYPNLATGGLVLAYSADGETIGIAPQQPTRNREAP